MFRHGPPFSALSRHSARSAQGPADVSGNVRFRHDASASHRTQHRVAPDRGPGQASGVTGEGCGGVMKCHEMSGSVMALLSSPFPVIPTGAAVRPRSGAESRRRAWGPVGGTEPRSLRSLRSVGMTVGCVMKCQVPSWSVAMRSEGRSIRVPQRNPGGGGRRRRIVGPADAVQNARRSPARGTARAPRRPRKETA